MYSSTRDVNLHGPYEVDESPHRLLFSCFASGFCVPGIQIEIAVNGTPFSLFPFLFHLESSGWTLGGFDTSTYISSSRGLPRAASWYERRSVLRVNFE